MQRRRLAVVAAAARRSQWRWIAVLSMPVVATAWLQCLAEPWAALADWWVSWLQGGMLTGACCCSAWMEGAKGRTLRQRQRMTSETDDFLRGDSCAR